MPRKSEIMQKDIMLVFSKTMQTLKDTWDEIGLSDHQISQRGEKVIYHTRALFDNMVAEETKLKKNLQQSIEENRSTLDDLCTVLSLPPFEPEPNLGMLQLEKAMRSQLNKMNVLKNERLAQLASLKEREEDLCDQLYATPYYIPKGSVPSQDQLDEIKDHIETLKAEKKKRRDLLTSQKSNILTLYDELGLTPDTSFSQEFIEDDVVVFLSTEKMDGVKKLLDHLTFCKSEAQIKIDGLMQQIANLWDRLEIDSYTRDRVKMEYNGIKTRDIEGLERILRELEILKMENMQKLTESLRSDITNFWDKCFYGAERRQRFSPFHNDNFTEELLNAHEAELNRLIEYYEKHKTMFASVREWQKAFDRMVELDDKQRNPDPNRYNNRGGQLLAEERERTKSRQQIPKIEKRLFKTVGEWEEEMNEPFLVDGTRFTDYVQQQWQDFELRKEEEKHERMMKKQKKSAKNSLNCSKRGFHKNGEKQKASFSRCVKMAEIKMEMTFGSTPAKTPTKKRPHGLPPRTPTTGKKSRLGGINSTTNRTATGGYPLTPSNRTNLYTSRASPGRTPISFRPGDVIDMDANGSVKLRTKQPKVKKDPATVKRTVPSNKNYVDRKQQVPQTSTVSSSYPSMRSAPGGGGGSGDHNNTFSVTVISEDPSRLTAPVEVNHEDYDDFANEIIKGPKAMRSSAVGDGRYL